MTEDNRVHFDLDDLLHPAQAFTRIAVHLRHLSALVLSANRRPCA
jgi:hypothetical protein